ncbi:MAG: class I SAM-dependent methyltransferase [Candidatus Heimdallarchaeota archaeon]|nr:class I SAM-dependent methyltransferase [Candidatus Heimdallarchaeota archaeon]
MTSQNQSKKNIEIVKKGYEGAAEAYREGKDPKQHETPIFQKFLTKTGDSPILELGCATGFPIGKALLEAGKNYTGIDISKKQIQMAHKEFPQWKYQFILAEMLEYVKNCSTNHFTGIVSIFSIRHLPRIHHAELYNELHRILKSRGLLLIDCTIEPHDGSSDDWVDLGAEQMYWSGFSKEWTMQTLKDLDFKLLSTYEDTKLFFEEEETTLFLLYEKP